MITIKRYKNKANKLKNFKSFKKPSIKKIIAHTVFLHNSIREGKMTKLRMKIGPNFRKK